MFIFKDKMFKAGHVEVNVFIDSRRLNWGKSFICFFIFFDDLINGYFVLLHEEFLFVLPL